MSKLQETLRLAFATVPDLIAIHSRDRGNDRALVQGDETVTYRMLDALIRRIAAGLQRDDVPQRSAVAIVSSNSIPAALVYLGALRAGCIAAPIAPSSTPDQIASMIVDCGALVVFVDADTAARLPRLPAKVVVLNELETWLPEEGAVEAPVTILPDDPFNIIYSSGTTGTPKGIVHTHAMRWTQIQNFSTTVPENAVTMIATPLYSNTTLVSFLPTLSYGATAVLMGKFDAREFLEMSERERATHAMLVPVQYQRIMAVPEFDRYDLSSYMLKSCTSAPFPAELKADVVKRWPGMLVEIYGMTEGGGTCILMANAFPHKLHTVGMPAPGNDIRLIDENGQEVAPGEIGEVVGRSTVMMAGYHGRPEATSAASWLDADGNRYMRHGDLGRFDEDGFLTLLGRTKDMIISGGFNVYPPDIEAVALQHPGVAECAVVGVPSAKWGETPFAFYVPRGEGVEPAELVAWVNSKVGKTQRLTGARAINELPRSAIGKVLKRELRDQLPPASQPTIKTGVTQMNLQGRVAIVTGGGAGLGRTHAHFLARQGAKVVVLDLGEDAFKVAKEIVDAGGDAVGFQASVTDEALIGKMVAETVERWGRIDILVNNAGILRDKSFAKMSLDDFRLVVEVHLMGSVICTKAVWEVMRKQNYGRIVLTTSSSGLFGNFGQSNYGAAKMAVVGLMQTLAIEGVKNNILVNCLAPTAATAMTGGLMTAQAKRVLQPAAVSSGLLALVGDQAPTRAILCAGGGNFALAHITMTTGAYIGTDANAAERVVEQWEQIGDRTGDAVPESGLAQVVQEISAAFRVPQN